MKLQAGFFRNWTYHVISKAQGLDFRLQCPVLPVISQELLKAKIIFACGTRQKHSERCSSLHRFHKVWCKDYQFRSNSVFNIINSVQLQSRAGLHDLEGETNSVENQKKEKGGNAKFTDNVGGGMQLLSKEDNAEFADNIGGGMQLLSASISTTSENIDWGTEMDAIIKQKRGPLEEADSQQVDDYVPQHMSSFNLATYVNKSILLQKMVELGVSLYHWEKQKEVGEYILRLDYEEDVVPYIRFLLDIGVPVAELGFIFTHNPYIFQESLDDYQVRVNYLKSKKFSPEMIARIVSKNPQWLSFRVAEIDGKLGHFQKTFGLTGDEVRNLAVKNPRLITLDMGTIQRMTFSIKEELGFEDQQIKDLLLKKPAVWRKNVLAVIERFDYVHNQMKLSHEMIVRFPELLMSRLFRLKQRHLFLKSLKRDQFDPTKEGYVSPKAFLSGTDVEFCRDVAKCSIETFNIFLKTL